MTTVTVEVKKWGNSLGTLIPKETVKKLDIKEGELLCFDIMPKRKISGFGIAKNAKSFKRELDDHEF